MVMESLRCQVPPASLLPIALEGRLFSPAEALQLELVHEVLPPDGLVERALDKATALAALPSIAFQAVKHALRRPVTESIRAQNDRDASRWTETWFSDAGQAQLRAAAARITKK